jgi:hypothetical protein
MRLAVVMLMLVAGTLVGVVTGVGPASASALVTCHDGSLPWDSGSDDYAGGGHGRLVPWERDDRPVTEASGMPVWVTSTRCQDVNLRITMRGPGAFHTIRARVCFHPWSRAAYCQASWTSISAYNNGWVEVAKYVNDNTRFRVEFDNPGDYIVGVVAS